MNTMSGLRKDYVASYLRSQVGSLSAVLDQIENSNCKEDDFVRESLKRVEMQLRRLRKTNRLN